MLVILAGGGAYGRTGAGKEIKRGVDDLARNEHLNATMVLATRGLDKDDNLNDRVRTREQIDKLCTKSGQTLKTRTAFLAK